MEEFFEASLFSKPFLSAVVVAAGSSVRMGGMNKIFLPLSGIPVVARSLLAYENCEDVSEIVVVTKESSIGEIEKLAEEYKGIVASAKFPEIPDEGGEKADEAKSSAALFAITGSKIIEYLILGGIFAGIGLAIKNFKGKRQCVSFNKATI